MAKTPRNRYGGANVPSQAPSRRVPYSPVQQEDVWSTEGMRGAKPIGYPPSGSFVVSAYDARPTQAIDFAKRFRVQEGDRVFLNGDVEPLAVARTAEFVIPIPPAATAVLKEIEFSVEIPNDPSEDDGIIDRWGFPSDDLINAEARISILVNNSPVPEWGDLLQPDNLFAPIRLSSYILIPGGQNLTFQFYFRNANDAINNFVMYGTMYGNYLLSKGTSLPEEPVNTEALPIRYGGLGEKGTLGIRGTKE